MIGFALGLLFGAAIASGSLYALYLWAHPDQKAASGKVPSPKPEPPRMPPVAVVPAPAELDETVNKPLVPAPDEPIAEPAASSANLDVLEPSPPPPTAETEWLGELSNRIEGEIGSHSFRIEEISASLRRAKEGEPDVVLDAASRIMLANQQLQAELMAARNEIDEHRAKVKELAAEARTDVLTGLANRRAFTEDLERRFEQWRRHGVPLSLIMVDIDHFQSINDTYAHAGGDTALRHLGDLLRDALRQMDIPARYGGEEFAIILPGTKMADAINVAERLRATIAAKGFVFEDQTIPLTASLGLATALSSDSSSSVVERADEALYAAKQAGRNRAYVHDGHSEAPIDADKALVRHPFRDLQQIAPFKLGGSLPRAADFYPVRCYDLSVKGISFLSSIAPDFQALVVRLGNPPEARYMISSIANVAMLAEDDEQLYRVGCTFVSRLDAEEILADPDDSICEAEPQLCGV
jgi:diguanylate cyclase (GGDEF)-like protein